MSDDRQPRLQIDRTLSVGSIIQIVLLIFSIVGFLIAYYYGVANRLDEAQRRQDDLSADLTDIRTGIREIADGARAERMEIGKRLTEVEKFAIRYDITGNAADARLDRLNTQLQALDEFVREELPRAPR